MRIEVDKKYITRLVNCGMLIMVSTSNSEKKNTAPCAWHTPLSKSPPLLGIALAKKHFSSNLIKQTNKFIINILGWEHLSSVVQCGKISGYEKDKFTITGFTPQSGIALKDCYFIKESVCHIECELKNIYDVSDHHFFVGEGVYAEADDEYFKEGIWDTSNLDLIFHLGGSYFFKSSPAINFDV